MASRPVGLKFGRFIFEFGISGSAGSIHGSREPPFPIWRGTTALLERYCRLWVAVLLFPIWRGTTALFERYYRAS